MDRLASLRGWLVLVVGTVLFLTIGVLIGTGITATFSDDASPLVVNADGDDDDDDDSDGDVAGTYFITIEPDGGSSIVTLTSDGNWLSTNSQQFTIAFGDQQGAWQKTGQREITAKVLDFNFSLPDGVQNGVTRSRWVVTFDSDFKKLEGTVEVEIFAPDQNPLHPTEPPFIKLSSTFEGQRVTVDD